MRYEGSEAYYVDGTERRRERPEGEVRRSFEVVSGGGLDARVRAGITPTFLARVRTVLVVAAVLIVVGMVRVALSSATVSLLQSNVDLSTRIEDAQALNNKLRIERSVLSSNSRISRIATQNYGMVLPTESVHVGGGTDEQINSTNGEAAQTTDEAGAQSDVA